MVSYPVIARCPEVFGSYRYRLTVALSDPDREANSGHLAVVMLNPATVHEETDLVLKPRGARRRLVKLATNERHHTVTELDLFAYRCPDRGLLNRALRERGVDAVGPENDRVISQTVEEADKVIVAWGKVSDKPHFAERAAWVEQLLKASGKPLYCLGRNRDGSPKHPARGTNRIQPWP